MNDYFTHWKISNFVFNKQRKDFFSLPYQKNVMSKLKTFTYMTPKSVVLVGPPGVGKSTIINQYYKSLPLYDFCCLMLQPVGLRQIDLPITNKIICYLDTNIIPEKQNEQVMSIFTEKMSLIKRQRKSLIVFVDMDINHQNTNDLIDEINLLTNIASKLNLPLTIIHCKPIEFEQPDDKHQNPMHDTICLNRPTVDDCIIYTEKILTSSQLRQDLFKVNDIEQIYHHSRKSLSLFNRLCEDILIEAANQSLFELRPDFIQTTLTEIVKQKDKNLNVSNSQRDQSKADNGKHLIIESMSKANKQAQIQSNKLEEEAINKRDRIGDKEQSLRNTSKKKIDQEEDLGISYKHPITDMQLNQSKRKVKTQNKKLKAIHKIPFESLLKKD